MDDIDHGDERFRFGFDPRFAPLLAAIGVVPTTSFVTITPDDEIIARFGPWSCRSPLTNVVEVSESGPYRWWRAIGARLSFADRGATFGSNADAGVCLRFAQPVRALAPTGALRHPGLTVTVADPERFAERVRVRVGLSR